MLKVELRVCPGTLLASAWPSDHEANRGEQQKSARLDVEIFPVLRQSATSVEPRQAALDPASLGQHDKALDLIGSFDDLQLGLRQGTLQRFLKLRPLIATISIKLYQERKHAEQRGQQHRAAVTILDVRGSHDGLQQQTLGINQDMPLLSLDL